MLDLYKIRNDFPILQRRINDKQIVYLDNAATTQKPTIVIDKLSEFYYKYNANIRRGVSSMTEEATRIFEDTREKIKDFFKAKNYELVFTKSTTESINLVAHSLIKKYLSEGDEIILTEAEHHSNIVPFHIVSSFKKLKVKYMSVDNNGELDVDELKKLITSKVKLISVAHITNVFGIKNPIEKIIKIAGEYNIPILIDGAQSAPCIEINLDVLSPTFFVFSAHKMLGTNGLGFLFIKKDFAPKMAPFLGGGSMITEVDKEYSAYLDIPYLFEGGTIDYPAVAAFSHALDYISNIGMKNIEEHEINLTKKLLNILDAFPEIETYGPKNMANRMGIVSFNLKNVHPHDFNTLLDANAIFVRSGHHCAQVLMKKFNIPGTVRASFYIYNTLEEIDRLAIAVQKALILFKVRA